MRSSIPRLTLTAAALAAIVVPSVGLVASLAGASPAAPRGTGGDHPIVKVTPGGFDRGADTAVGEAVGDTIVSAGDVIDVPGHLNYLLGPSGDGFVVNAGSGTGDVKLWFVEAGQDPRLIAQLGRQDDSYLSSDGERAIVERTRFQRKLTDVEVLDVATGEQTASKTFRGIGHTLDASADEAIVSARGVTLDWTFATNRSRTISDQYGYRADIGLNRLAVMTGDPYSGGCTRVAPLDRPGQTVWRSCDAAVLDWAPGGRIATDFILSDGPGPTAITVRRPGGGILTEYRAGKGLVSIAGWEGGGTPILLASNRQREALLRCDGLECERAGDFHPSDDF